MSIKANLVVSQGTNFLTEIEIVDIDGLAIDLTGYTATAFLKKEWSSLANTKITIDTSISASDGIITISMTHAATANITPQNYVWACDVLISNTKSRICSGTVKVEPSIDWPA